MTASSQPVMALLDLLSQRWTLRVLWELHLSTPDPLTFRALQARCEDMSSSVLSRRLTTLREARIITKDARGYLLSTEGTGLVARLRPLDEWARTWAATG